MDEKILELIEMLTDKVEALEESNKNLKAQLSEVAKTAGIKSKEEDEADDKHAEELLKNLMVEGKDF